jgi:chromosome segregation ATPase
VRIINNQFLGSEERLKSQLSSVETELLQVSARLAKLYSSLEDGKLAVDDLAPRIKELRASQHDLQGRRQELIKEIESGGAITMDEATVQDYVEELRPCWAAVPSCTERQCCGRL